MYEFYLTHQVPLERPQNQHSSRTIHLVWHGLISPTTRQRLPPLAYEGTSPGVHDSPGGFDVWFHNQKQSSEMRLPMRLQSLLEQHRMRPGAAKWSFQCLPQPVDVPQQAYSASPAFLKNCLW